MKRKTRHDPVAKRNHPGPKTLGENHSTLTPGEQAREWKPNHAQKHCLAMVALDLSLANDRRRMLMLAEVGDRRWANWNAQVDFATWWNAELINLCRLHSGPALAKLLEVCTKAGGNEMAQVKAIDTFLRHTGIERTPNAEGALLSMLEKWKGQRLRVALEVGGDEPTTVPEVDAPPIDVEVVKPALHNDSYQNQNDTQMSLQSPPPGAMVCGPASIESGARQAMEEMEIDHPVGSVPVYVKKPEPEGEERPWDLLSVTGEVEDGLEDQGEETQGGLESQSRPADRIGPDTADISTSAPDWIQDRLSRRVDP